MPVPPPHLHLCVKLLFLATNLLKHLRDIFLYQLTECWFYFLFFVLFFWISYILRQRKKCSTSIHVKNNNNKTHTCLTQMQTLLSDLTEVDVERLYDFSEIWFQFPRLATKDSKIVFFFAMGVLTGRSLISKVGSTWTIITPVKQTENVNLTLINN